MEKNLYSQIYDTLQKGKALVLARIIKSSGSTPRGIGSICFIDEDGVITGTIGGGLLEYKVSAKAKELFHTKVSWIYHFQLSQDESAREGMICGGEVTCYLEPLFPKNKALLEIFHSINNLLEKGQSAILLTLISHGIDPMDENCRNLVSIDHPLISNIVALGKGKIKLEEIKRPVLLKCDDSDEYAFVEPIAPAPFVILCGAGHISACVAPLAKMVGFKVIVLDDRREFANRERFPMAERICVGPFVQTLGEISITKSSYIVIVTRGHAFDKAVLKTVLDSDPAYIGMIGSIRKRDALYDALIKEGASQEKLSTVYSPIGTEIDAQTPEEIAVSIVGELIKTRAAGFIPANASQRNPPPADQTEAAPGQPVDTDTFGSGQQCVQ
ncbi:MAG: XdhC family aldehyde oxidoreductase maturation factor [Pseudomonadota bacterium]